MDLIQEVASMKEGHYLSVLGIFDEETNQQFTLLDGRLQDAQLKALGFYQEDPWHFSLGVYFDLEVDELLAWVNEVAENTWAINLRFNHIGLFPGVAFIQPTFSWPLRLFFERLHEKFDDRHGSYPETSRQYGLFVPHVSLIFTFDDLMEAVGVLTNYFQPFYGTMSQLLIYEYVKVGDRSFPVGPVATVYLKKDPAERRI